MTNALLIFTFSPVQSFIAEARRAADLYTGSQILVELAKAAGKVLEMSAIDKRLIYPVELTDDVPNKLMTTVPWEKCEVIAEEARAALLLRWKELAEQAHRNFDQKVKLPFKEDIWQRQTADDYLWETYWTAASLERRDYKEAYAEAENGLTAVKFTRSFMQFPEPGFKDTLSGKRQALCAGDGDGQKYWFKVGNVPEITPIKIRPSTEARPRERLDAIGIIKRFHPELSEKTVDPFHGFPSTSSMAAASFLESARTNCLSELKSYRDAIAALLPDKKYKIREDDAWPYDGDLFYPETLRPRRLEGDYGKKIPAADPRLKKAQAALQALCHALKEAAKKDTTLITRPSPYYAIIVLDGDSMGKHLRTLNEGEHRTFSASLRQFALAVKPLADKHLAKVIYNGGDDVLAMAPLKSAFTFARQLAALFNEETKQHASAGIAIAHHLSPLSHTLQAARRAEHQAKELDGKNAVCVIALKHSGEPIQVRSHWDAVSDQFEKIVHQFESDEISSKLPYDVDRSAYGLPQADKKLETELCRLIKRHLQKGTAEEKKASALTLSQSLREWAQSFILGDADNQPADQLADWLALARFVAKGGRE